MKISEILLMYDYNYWANELLMDRCEALTVEQYTDIQHPHSFKSIRGTLIHILDSECGWRVTLQNQMQAQYNFDDLNETTLPTFVLLRERWNEEKTITYSWLKQFTDADLEASVRYPIDNNTAFRERVLWHCLYHVVNHGMQHRSEVAAILTTLGMSPGDIDFTVFLNERGISLLHNAAGT